MQGVWKILPLIGIGFHSFLCRDAENLAQSEDSVQFDAYTVTHPWFVYYNSSSENVLNLGIGKYFPNTLYVLVCVDMDIGTI